MRDESHGTYSLPNTRARARAASDTHLQMTQCAPRLGRIVALDA